VLAITGYGSNIVTELKSLLPRDEVLDRIDKDYPIDADRYLLCAGVLRPKRITEQTSAEMEETWHINFIRPILICEHVLDNNPDARICIIGSDSGFKWSYDGAYAGAKAALHRYIETKKLEHPNQQLVGIAPSIIEDSRMTASRTDIENLKHRRETHAKKRFLSAMEVAKLVHYLLYVDEGYISGTVIHMDGGGWK
jgi:3-oxoacyl-[acyl-carrier protein] reductase